jgi:hypothetical protein
MPKTVRSGVPSNSEILVTALLVRCRESGRRFQEKAGLACARPLSADLSTKSASATSGEEVSTVVVG